MAEEAPKTEPVKPEPVKQEAAKPASQPATSSSTGSSSSGGGSSALKIVLIVILVLVLLGIGGCVAVGLVAKKAVNSASDAISEQAEQLQSELESIEASFSVTAE